MLTNCYVVKPSQVNGRRGFTLVELLIVISIIGVLVALTMPAVQSARESGRRALCQNNLHQLAVGCQGHEAQWHYFPTGGLSKSSTGDSTISPGPKQPGGWHYNILPYLDMKDLHDMKSGQGQKAIPIFLCPTRHGIAKTFASGSTGAVMGISDYAGNAGSNFVYAGQTNSNSGNCNGVIIQAGCVSTAQIKDGLGYTYLIGERFLTIGAYSPLGAGGVGAIENDVGWNSGYDYNTIRWTALIPPTKSTTLPSTTLLPPLQDQHTPTIPGNPPTYDPPLTPTQAPQWATLFGSAHPAGFHMVFCDGSIKKISYAINPIVHAQLGCKDDAEPTDLSKLE